MSIQMQAASQGEKCWPGDINALAGWCPPIATVEAADYIPKIRFRPYLGFRRPLHCLTTATTSTQMNQVLS